VITGPYCNHDVHRFANGVVLVRVDPSAIGNVMIAPYDRGQGAIVVERGTGRVREVMAGTPVQLDSLRRSVEGMW
jgi:hypothetical protein